MVKKYWKWIVLVLLIWFGLISIFWSTSIYGYNGFLISLSIVCILFYLLFRYRRKLPLT